MRNGAPPPPLRTPRAAEQGEAEDKTAAMIVEKAASMSPPPSPRADAKSAMELFEEKRKEAERVRANIELFVDGLMSEKYSMAELLNESFSPEMLELLFKRMTSRLRAILFARDKTLEFIRIALDASYPEHTRSMATQFIVVGNAGNSLLTCVTGEPHTCTSFWETIFGTLLNEAAGVSSKCGTQEQRRERLASVAELEELIQVEVKVFEKDGAETLKRSDAEIAKDIPHTMGKVDAVESDVEPPTPVSQRSSVVDDGADQDSPPGSSPVGSTPVSPSNPNTTDKRTPFNEKPSVDEANIPAPLETEVGENAQFGIFSHDSANFASQILRYFAIRGQKGACILQYLSEHAEIVDMLIANIGHDDVRTLLLHLIYSEHSEEAIRSLFETHMLQKLIMKQVTFSPPRNAFERDCIENTSLLLREIVHAPYLTARGVAISAKVIPLDKVTGQDEYVSICGASREMANSSLRKYTSRKVRRLIHLFMQQHQQALELLFVQMIKELTFWSTPALSKKERRPSITSIESLTLLAQGHPRPTCILMLTHLFELTETVEFTNSNGQNGTSATVGIDCLNFMCSTHLMRKGNLLVRKKLKNEIQLSLVSLNCMMGLRVTSLREDSKSAASSQGFTQNQGNQTIITLDEMDSVQSSDWHEFGFSVVVKKKVVSPSKPSPHAHNGGAAHGQAENGAKGTVKSVEYFAASSEKEKQAWMQLLQSVIDGDLNELEIFCSDDWRSNVREYRRLRECLITCMERKGHELMVFLKQVILSNTRKVSGFHLWTIVKLMYAVLSTESKRLDRMFVSAHVINTLLLCYEKYPMWNLLLGEITKILVFCFGDFKGKRSRSCPIIGRMLLSEGPDARLLPLLTKAFVGRDIEDGESRDYDSLAATDALSNLKLLMESIKLCYKDPKTRSQERIRSVLTNDKAWQRVLKASEEMVARDPRRCITSVPTPPSSTPSHSPGTTPSHSNGGRSAAPPQPTFQEDIIKQISRPTYSAAHGYGSSFLLGEGCAFGYLFKERRSGEEWQKALVVYEYESYKLWYFYPSEVDETHTIQWKWIIPLSVRNRYTHGQDETHTSVGHHGLFVTAYDDQQSDVDSKAPAKEMHFSVTKLEDRDLWKDVLASAAEKVQKLCKEYTNKAAKMKKPDKKTVTQCQNPECNQPFKLFRRPHSCKRCGKWMCAKCTQQRLSIPEVGLLHPVRHCQSCFDAQGGAQADVEPLHLFRPLGGRHTSIGGNADGRAGSEANLTNAELYELAHGLLSPQTLTRRNQRLDSVDSPTHGLVDEVDEAIVVDAKGFPVDDDEILSPFPSPLARRSLVHMREDIRG